MGNGIVVFLMYLIGGTLLPILLPLGAIIALFGWLLGFEVM